MWEHAAVANPKDEKLLELWFKTKFTAQNYKAAQKVHCSRYLRPQIDAKTILLGCYAVFKEFSEG